MATVAEHAQNIVALAETADGLVASFRQLMADLQAEEAALSREALANGPAAASAVAGHTRLGTYALSRARYPAGASLPPEKARSVSELANTAWKESLPKEGE